jgi:hypothetical protein
MRSQFREREREKNRLPGTVVTNEKHNQNTRSDNKVHEVAIECLPWQQWTETSVWFDDIGIPVFHSCVVDLWQFLSEWRLLLSQCVLVCRGEHVGA